MLTTQPLKSPKKSEIASKNNPQQTLKGQTLPLSAPTLAAENQPPLTLSRTVATIQRRDDTSNRLAREPVREFFTLQRATNQPAEFAQVPEVLRSPAVNARAYTVGHQVVMRQEEYAPATKVGTPTPISIRTVKVWLNAFIPDIVPGKTIHAPASHTGKTMLNGPIFSGCYLTDNRTFNANIGASSRMHSEIEINISGPSETFSWHHCYETHEINCTTGAAICTGNGRTSDMKFKNLRGSSTSTIQIDLEGASNNPCYTGSPDIDYEGTFTIDVGRRIVEFTGKIDAFPAFEAYATADGGAGVMMFNTMPLAGKSPWNLPGDATRVQTGRASI